MISKQDGEEIEIVFFSETIVEFDTEPNRMVGIVGGNCEPWYRDHRHMQLEP